MIKEKNISHKLTQVLSEKALKLINFLLKEHNTSNNIFVVSKNKLFISNTGQANKVKAIYKQIESTQIIPLVFNYIQKEISINETPRFLQVFFIKEKKSLFILTKEKIEQETSEAISDLIYLDRKAKKKKKQLKKLKKEKLETLNEKATEELKTMFLANLSHEIKTPMNSIIGFTDLLQIPNLQSEKVMNFAQIANNNAKRLLTLLENIIDLSKIETNSIKLKDETIPIVTLLNEIYILNNNKLLKEKKNINFSMNLPDYMKHYNIKADSIRIKQILSILLANAINFTEEGSILLGAKLDKNNEVQFYVKDTGCGIKEKHKEKIFLSFNQGGSFLKRNNEGSGLGLSIAKGILNLYKRDLLFKSKTGVGSTFYFSLPICE